MELKLFPPVTHRAVEALRTASVVVFDELAGIPGRTWLCNILVDVGPSSKVLPVVGVDTEGFVV